ncbi:hypothetical protein Tco_0071286, partial [Tanacetum coccineum]
QVADAARNLEILRDRDDYDRSERSDKRHKSGDRFQSVTQQNSYRSHDQKNDRQGSDRQGGGGNYRNNYFRDNNRSNLNRYRLYLLYDMNLTSRHGNRNSGAGRDQRNRESAMASLMFFGSFRLTDFQLLVLTDDLLSNDVKKDVIDRMYAGLTSQDNVMMSPLFLVPVY